MSVMGNISHYADMLDILYEHNGKYFPLRSYESVELEQPNMSVKTKLRPSWEGRRASEKNK